MGIHVHLSESVSEIEQIREKYGCSPSLYREKSPELMKTDLKGKYAGIHNL